MLGRSFSAPGTYNLPPGNMKSACVSTAHRTRALGAMPVSACRLLDAASLYREPSNDKRSVWGASRRKAGKHEGHEGTARENRDSNYFVRFVSFVAYAHRHGHSGLTCSVILAASSSGRVWDAAAIEEKVMSQEPAQQKSPSRLIIRNIGLLLSGDLENPILDADTVLAVEGKIAAVGKEKDIDCAGLTTVVDAKGTTLAPGLIDSHVHPVAG